MTEVISVRFRGGCKTYYFDPRGTEVAAGTDVIVETAQGTEFASCVEGNHPVEDSEVVSPLCPLLRVAGENDRKTLEYNQKREKEAFDICQKKIAGHGLEMKLVSVSCNFDGNKIIFFFTADGRVDFRELVRDLASIFRARIELRQIGVRDEAKMLGGLGICGRPFCCSQFLDGFLPVSIKMAKTQSLSLNPTKISGTCGRLMCCLKYEQEAYEDAVRRMPKAESFVQTPDGVGNVTNVNLLRETVKVRLDDQTDNTQHCYHNCEVCVLRNGKGTRDGVIVPNTRPDRYVEQLKPEDEFHPVTSPLFEELPDSLPVREKIAVPDEERSRRRGRRGGKPRRPEGEGIPPTPAQPAPKSETARREPRPPRKPAVQNLASVPGSPVKTAPEKPVPDEGGEGAARRRPHHRGGRRRGPSAPKKDE